MGGGMVTAELGFPWIGGEGGVVGWRWVQCPLRASCGAWLSAEVAQHPPLVSSRACIAQISHVSDATRKLHAWVKEVDECRCRICRRAPS